METVVITGATGFIGRRLVQVMHETHGAPRIVTLTRDPERTGAALGSSFEHLSWDAPEAWKPVVRSADVVFHLAGEPVMGQRWTPEYRQRILDSRTETTTALAKAGPRGAFVSASAVGYYGDTGTRTVTDTNGPSGDDFLAQVCVAWEAAADRAAATAAHVTKLRIGVVLGKGGGPLDAMLPPFRRGLGGPLGSGRQWFPWVHLEDVVGLALLAATDRRTAGPLNAVAPDPVTNAQLAAALGKALGRPAFLPVPAAALRAIVGDMSYALLYSQRILPERALDLGYRFRFPDLTAALADIL